MRRSLSPIIFPDRPAFRRKTLLPEAFRPNDFEENYDYNTLAYDIIKHKNKSLITLICPKLFNFEKIVRSGRFHSDREALRISSIKRRYRYDEIWLKYKSDPDVLYFQCDDFSTQASLSPDEHDIFKNMNCCVTKSKNNSLDWIGDWIEFHIHHHNLESLLFFDNNSDIYTIEELNHFLLSIKNLKQLILISAPFKFGTFYKKKYAHRAKFLQLGLLNIARLRFLQEANAVLSIDIDELVSPIHGSTIFEETRKSLIGYKLFSGRWRHALIQPPRESRHSDHIYKTDKDICKATKYCIAPRGALKFRPWDVHGVIKGSLKQALISKHIYYYHCRQITTRWKHARAPADRNQIFVDKEIKSIFADTFRTEAGADVLTERQSKN